MGVCGRGRAARGLEGDGDHDGRGSGRRTRRKGEAEGRETKKVRSRRDGAIRGVVGSIAGCGVSADSVALKPYFEGDEKFLIDLCAVFSCVIHVYSATRPSYSAVPQLDELS